MDADEALEDVDRVPTGLLELSLFGIAGDGQLGVLAGARELLPRSLVGGTGPRLVSGLAGAPLPSPLNPIRNQAIDPPATCDAHSTSYTSTSPTPVVPPAPLTTAMYARGGSVMRMADSWA